MTDDNENGTTRRQVLAGTAGIVSVPAWASHSDEAAAAYDRNFNTPDGRFQQNANFAGIHMREDWWEDIDVQIQAYAGDQDIPNGMIEFKMNLGPFHPSLTFTAGEARELAQKLRHAANDAEILTRAQMKDYRERTP